MIRTQVSLTEEQMRRLRREARRRHVSLAAIVRDAVDQVVPDEGDARSARVDALLEVAGSAASGSGDVARDHDEVLAATSHLPHMLAFGLVDALARMKENDEIFRYAAGGFRDFTRIASSNPVMWRDICLANRVALSRMISSFATELQDTGIAGTETYYVFFAEMARREALRRGAPITLGPLTPAARPRSRPPASGASS